jgi:IS1 family transposase
MLSLWRDLHVTECQLDELWSFVHTKQDHLPAAKLYCETYGDAWVWLAFAPVWRLVLAFVIGKRTQASANLLLARLVQVTDDRIPFFTSDQLPEYKNSLLHTYGQWQRPARRGCRGPHPKPQRQPPPELLYAQVVKKRDKGRIVAVGTRIVFGEPAAIAARLVASPVSQTLNTRFVERDNLTQRQHNRRLTRRTTGFSKDITGFKKQLWLSLAYPLGVASREFAGTFISAATHAGHWLTTQMASRNASNGGRYYRSRLDDGRVAILPGTGKVPGSANRNRTPIPKT